MNDEVSILRLRDAWRECERNVYYLGRAVRRFFPILFQKQLGHD